MGTVSIDIDIEEIVNSMDQYDIAELVQYLQLQGLADASISCYNGKLACWNPGSRDQFNQSMAMLSKNQHRLSLEEEQYIINLASKL